MEILKYSFNPPEDNDIFWRSFWKRFIENEYLNLPSGDQIFDQILNLAINKFGHIDSIPVDDNSNIVFMGPTFILEFKYFNKYRYFNFSAPDGYLKYYPGIIELKKMVNLVDLFRTNFRFIEY